MSKKQTTTVNVGTRLAKLIRRVNDPVMVRVRQGGGKWVDHGMFPNELTTGDLYKLRIRRSTVRVLRELDKA